MAKLRVDKIAASGQTSENTGAVFFDGSGDYLKIGEGSTDFSFGTDDFTVETWIYPTSLNAVNAITGNAQTSYTDNEWLLYFCLLYTSPSPRDRG